MSKAIFNHISDFFKCFIFLIFISAAAFAQRPEGDSLQQKLPAIGRVTGIVMDSISGKPAEFASVALLQVSDSFPVSGSLTDERGNFIIEEVPAGRFILKISSIGFKDFTSGEVRISPDNANRNLGKIYIHTSVKRLKEVEISGEKSEYVNSLDRKVYNLDKNIVNTGGTATEVLQNIPSVTVDMDGNISLRGSGNVNVLIDGKPSGITGSSRQAVLQQVPAASIERIEVITNPSAKYDADGMAGIINIVTKKDKLKGVNANLSIGVGTNDKYNASIGGNYRTKKFNVFGNYAFRHERRTSEGETVRRNFYGDTIFYDLSNNHGTNLSDMHVGKVGIEFFLSESMTLGAGVTASWRDEERPEYTSYRTENAMRELTSSFIRDNEDDGDHQSYDYTLDLRKTFNKGKGDLTASAAYSTNERNSYDLVRTYTDTYQLTLRQDIFSETENATGTYQVNYAHQFSKSSQMEAGWKSTIRSIDVMNNGTNYFPVTNITEIEPRFIDRFLYDEQVHALFVMYTSKFNKFDYQVGLRGEEYLNEGKSETTSIDFNNEYLNLYPSGFLKYQLAKTQELQVSYSRRVNRPESRSMNPFIDFADTLNVRKGNPEVKPEYIDSYELSWLKNFEKHSVTLTLYYRHTQNLISRFRTLDPATNVTTTTFINYSSSENTGAEVVIKNQLGEAVNMMTSANIFENKINGSNIESDLQSTSTNWNARTTINVRLMKNTSLQVTAMYTAPSIQPQGSFRGMSGVDAGIRQELWKGRASLSLNVNDIFNTRKMVITNTGEGFELDMTRRRESRVAMLNFAYRFGSAELGQRKRNQQNQNQQQDPGNMIDDF